MYKIILMSTLCLLGAFANNVYAQSDWNQQPEEEERQGIFQLQPFQKNHQISIQLPNEGLLVIDFLRLSDWGEQNELRHLASLAGKQVNNLADSFKYPSSAKTVAMNIPLNEQILSLAYYEDNSFGSQLAYKDNEYYQLKTSFDTIRIIRNKAIRTAPKQDSGLVQVGYTFTLKKLEDINSLIQDEKLWDRIGDSIDNKVRQYRAKWQNQDSRAHKLSVQYNADKEEAVNTYIGDGALFPALRNKLAVYLGIGGILFNNQMAPVVDMTLAYVFPSNKKSRFFLGLNAYSFATFDSDLNPIRQFRSYNVEVGTFRNSRGLMRSKLSLAYGVLFSDVKTDKTMFNMIINWGVTNYMTVGMNVASTLNFNKSNKGILAVHLKFNF